MSLNKGDLDVVPVLGGRNLRNTEFLFEAVPLAFLVGEKSAYSFVYLVFLLFNLGSQFQVVLNKLVS